MKKTLFSIITLFVACFFAVNVNAAVNRLSIPNTTKAVSPETVPSTSDVLYGTTTEAFDFSKVQFAGSEASDPAVAGKTDLRKIIIGDLKDLTSVSSLTLDTTFNKWFTAYCLDNAKKYPIYGLLTSRTYANASTAELKLDEVVLAAIANDDNVQKAVSNKSNLTGGRIFSVQVVEIDAESGDVVDRFYELTGTETASDVIANIENLNTSVTIKLKKVVFTDESATQIEVTAADITGNESDTTYDLVFKGKDILFEKYNVTDTGSNIVKSYDHALWIIEHSYPTLALKTSIEATGADYDVLRKEICVIEGHTYDETTSTCSGFDALDDYVENYVYGTVQYAIWKVTGHKVGTKTIGNELANKDVLGELNKLYTYLIKDRNYTGYATKTFTNKLTVSTPKDGKELYKESKDKYVYGPYTVDYDVLIGGEVTLSIGNTDKTGIKLINEAGDEISTISKGGTFYIECAKSAKVSNVTVKVKLNDVSVFEPLANRGRIYTPKYAIEQNVMSGGKIVNKNLETSVELVTNPKTGVENVALLLIVTLVAFTLSYLLLSYKQKPIQQLS